ncbi:MAG: hypothetical protein ACPGSD_10730 [Flavobacteriales bacterium]
MNTNQHLENLSEIRNIMEKSTKFISLSGLSGVSAGIVALIGSVIAFFKMNMSFSSYENENGDHIIYNMTEGSKQELIVLALIILFIALSVGGLFTYLKTKKNTNLVWTSTSKKLLINLLIPLVTGGIFCLLLIKYEFYGLLAPATLIFYGLACLNASHYTLSDIRYLGIFNLVLGLLNAYFIGYGLIFWAIGFGVLHIVYGSIMYFKYDRK